MRARRDVRLRWMARGLALLWGGWWTFFGLAAAISEGLDLIGVLVHMTVPGLFFLMLALIPWKWEDVGGALLVLVGLGVLVVYPAMAGTQPGLVTVSAVLVTMALPPLLAGAMCLACWRRTQLR